MRISDWSSDVCSSDLRDRPGQGALCGGAARRGTRRRGAHEPIRAAPALQGGHDHVAAAVPEAVAPAGSAPADAERRDGSRRGRPRSEEHTSELQSLMRISYAVFCLKKKTTTTHITNV